jgi:hypothetical protein
VPSRSGVVTAVDDRLISVRWGLRLGVGLRPSAGSLRVTGHEVPAGQADVPDEADAKRAVRALADHQVLHIRHYGHDRQDDIHIG